MGRGLGRKSGSEILGVFGADCGGAGLSGAGVEVFSADRLQCGRLWGLSRP